MTVSVLLKLAKRYEISVPQAIVWNYFIAVVLSALIYKPQPGGISPGNAPVAVFAALAVLLPSLFIILGLSVRYTGIVRTELAQRLSLFIPLVTAFFIFGEPLSGIKTTGIIAGFIAIICSIQWNKGGGGKEGRASWLYPLVVFAGMGIIDVLFKRIAAYTAIPYTTSLFIVFLAAFIISAIVFVAGILSRKTKFNWVNLFCGLILGFFNFGNILFYIRAHKALPENPSLVFSAMNIGVIVIGSLTGILVFKEKLSLLNKAGIILALVAILIITYSA